MPKLNSKILIDLTVKKEGCSNPRNPNSRPPQFTEPYSPYMVSSQ